MYWDLLQWPIMKVNFMYYWKAWLVLVQFFVQYIKLGNWAVQSWIYCHFFFWLTFHIVFNNEICWGFWFRCMLISKSWAFQTCVFRHVSDFVLEGSSHWLLVCGARNTYTLFTPSCYWGRQALLCCFPPAQLLILHWSYIPVQILGLLKHLVWLECCT